jgi:hypothetical protein
MIIMTKISLCKHHKNILFIAILPLYGFRVDAIQLEFQIPSTYFVEAIIHPVYLKSIILF